MAQMTIYLADSLEAKVRRAAKSKRESVSRWISSQIERSLNESWPAAVIDAAGGLPCFPDLEELRKGYGKDAPREV
jgi:hypothetical protein